MATWNSRGLRGSVLEDCLKYTHEYYQKNGLGLLQKIPTPITPVKINEQGQIVLAYFEEKSTIDYMGVVQGIPVAFDAKECSVDTFPLHNIHQHQIDFMENFEKQGGVAFFLIYFSKRHLFYYLPFRQAKFFWERGKEGGRKSFRLDELVEDYIIRGGNASYVPWLVYLQLDLQERT